MISGECEKALSPVPSGCHASLSLLRAPDVLPCSIPFSTSLTFLSISPQTLVRLFPHPSIPLPQRNTQTSLMRHASQHPSLTHTRHTWPFLNTFQNNSHHSHAPESTSLPVLSSLLLWGFPFNLPPIMLFLPFPFLRFVHSSPTIRPMQRTAP